MRKDDKTTTMTGKNMPTKTISKESLAKDTTPKKAEDYETESWRLEPALNKTRREHRFEKRIKETENRPRNPSRNVFCFHKLPL